MGFHPAPENDDGWMRRGRDRSAVESNKSAGSVDLTLGNELASLDDENWKETKGNAKSQRFCCFSLCSSRCSIISSLLTALICGGILGVIGTHIVMMGGDGNHANHQQAEIIPVSSAPSTMPTILVPTTRPSSSTKMSSLPPSSVPINAPSSAPINAPSSAPINTLSSAPSDSSSPAPTIGPSFATTAEPAFALPSPAPINSPSSSRPTTGPSFTPTIGPSLTTTTTEPTFALPSSLPIDSPSSRPTIRPSYPSAWSVSPWPSDYISDFNEGFEYEAIHDGKRGAVFGMYSLYSSEYADRKFRFKASVPGVSSKLVQEAESIENSYGASLDCPRNMVLTFINLKINDNVRSWKYKCGSFDGWRFTSCQWTVNAVNEVASKINFQCPSNWVMAGALSVLDKVKEGQYDPRFQFKCCIVERAT